VGDSPEPGRRKVPNGGCSPRAWTFDGRKAPNGGASLRAWTFDGRKVPNGGISPRAWTFDGRKAATAAYSQVIPCNSASDSPTLLQRSASCRELLAP